MLALHAMMLAIVATVLGAILSGTWLAARRAHVPAPTGRVAAAFLLWLVFTGVLALGGALAPAPHRPPLVFLLAIVATVGLVRTSRGKVGGALLDATPAAWLIGLQVYRLAVELMLSRLGAHGLLPTRMTWSGSNFDVLVGLSAPIVAIAVARGWLGARGQRAWHLVSLGLVLNVALTAVLSAPGPQHLLASDAPLTLIGQLPWAWLPTVLVPIAVASHVIALSRPARS